MLIVKEQPENASRFWLVKRLKTSIYKGSTDFYETWIECAVLLKTPNCHRCHPQQYYDPLSRKKYENTYLSCFGIILIVKQLGIPEPVKLIQFFPRSSISVTTRFIFILSS